MEKNTVTSKPVAITDNDPKKLKGSTKQFSIGCIICVILGIFVVWAGLTMLDDLPSYADASDEFIPILCASAGFLLIFGGAVLPFAMKAAVKSGAKKHSMKVYEDHIEGTAIRIAGNMQTLTSFYESFDKISSVSTAKNTVMLMMRDSSSIRCITFNAEEIAAAIRERIM